ncbi:BPTI/Kunitz domain-containing protein-like [Ostrea edulis]|uniref:BPTI/Kunitz domain-containing protein-like n=1 Tax=Ostrea edulis TaxID=37623 RepID=UPI0020949656|nr:BPTI/Kunitz domain-containing protein-like [Ostrea edulis]
MRWKFEIFIAFFVFWALTEARRPPVCDLPWKSGARCRGRLERWWFNRATEVCERKYYGGCGANGNNFTSRNKCAVVCSEKVTVSLVECYQPREKGHGGGWLMRYYYNWRKQKCQRFVYKGNGGNTNRFRDLAECRRRCVW